MIDSYAAFAGHRLLAHGRLPDVLARTKLAVDDGVEGVLVFEDATGRQVDFDLSGPIEDVLDRVRPKPKPGRPKLGVVAREVSLLPRHWEWLEAQPQGISAALRRLVDEARAREGDAPAKRAARDAVGKLLWSLAGDLPGFEEATRALYADDLHRFFELVAPWPEDVVAHARRLLGGAGQPG